MFYLNVLPSLFWQTFRGKRFLFKTGVVTSSLLYRFSEFLRAGYIASARNRLFFSFFDPFFFTMVSKQYRKRFFAAKLIFEKRFLLYFFVLVVKQPAPTILKNRALSYQMIIFVHGACVLVGLVICFFLNLFLNDDCVFCDLFADIEVMKRIETVKNRVKTELKVSVQVVDVKQQKFAEILDTKYKEFQQALVKRKRFSDIWVSFDRRENYLLNQEIRTLLTLDEIDPFIGLNESEPVGSEEMSINDYPDLLGFDFSQFLKSFDFSSIPIFSFTTFQK